MKIEGAGSRFLGFDFRVQGVESPVEGGAATGHAGRKVSTGEYLNSSDLGRCKLLKECFMITIMTILCGKC